MNKKYKQEKKEKHSILNSSTRLLKALQEIHYNQGGTVSYVFVEERLEFSDTHPLGKTVKKKSTLSAPVNPQVFFEENKGKLSRRSPQDVIGVFQDSCDDMGATYFVLS